MSDETLLRKYMGRNGGAGPESDADSDSTDNFGAFGWLRGVRDRAISLELRKKCGNILAINYGFIDRVEFEPSEGIAIYSSGQKIRIRGRNLNTEARPLVRLFEGICRQRVPWIVEVDRIADLKAGQTATVIERIEW
jgi:hypothetical protein